MDAPVLRPATCRRRCRTGRGFQTYHQNLPLLHDSPYGLVTFSLPAYLAQAVHEFVLNTFTSLTAPDRITRTRPPG